jgi:hypothetical protein
VLFDAPLTGQELTTVTVPVHVVEGSATSILVAGIARASR